MVKLGDKFNVFGFKGTYKVSHLYPSKTMGEAISNTRGRIDITENIHSKKWIASKGTRTFGYVKWL